MSITQQPIFIEVTSELLNSTQPGTTDETFTFSNDMVVIFYHKRVILQYRVVYSNKMELSMIMRK